MGNKSSGGQGNEINQNNEEEKFVKSEIDQNCVVVFSKSFCPYCKATKNTFQNMGIDFKVIELDSRSDGNAIQDVLHKITGARTVSLKYQNSLVMCT